MVSRTRAEAHTEPPTERQAQVLSSDNMGPTLDLLMITFNCAKNFINVPVFANHLQTALGQNATSLPDLVVL